MLTAIKGWIPFWGFHSNTMSKSSALFAAVTLCFSMALLSLSRELDLGNALIVLALCVGVWASSFDPRISTVLILISIVGASVSDTSALISVPLTVPIVVAVYSYSFTLQSSLSCTLVLIISGTIDYSSEFLFIPIGLIAAWWMMLLSGFIVGYGLRLAHSRHKRVLKLKKEAETRAKNLQRVLHDSILSEITRARLAAELIADPSYSGDLDESQISVLIESMGEASKRVRQLILYLDSGDIEFLTPDADESSLRSCLQLCDEILTGNGFNVNTVYQAEGGFLDERQEQAFQSIVREVTTNIVKYGESEVPVHIRIEQSAEAADLFIKNSVKEARSYHDSTGRGLVNIASDVEMMRGEMRILESGATWQIFVRIPSLKDL